MLLQGGSCAAFDSCLRWTGRHRARRRVRFARSDSNRDSYPADGHPNGHSYAYANPNADSRTDAHPYEHANAHSDTASFRNRGSSSARGERQRHFDLLGRTRQRRRDYGLRLPL